MDRPVTLITGSRKGIGRFLADRYLRRGHVVVGCSRGEGEIESPHYHHFRLDVADEGEAKRLFGWVKKELGRLDHLINNAGIASMNHSLLTPLSSVREIFETNLVGAFLFCRESGKQMKKRGFGRIVNFATVAVPHKLEGEAAYVSSKAAVVSLTQVLAREFAEFGITVNAVGPTPVATDLIAGVPNSKIDDLIEKQAIKRLGTVDDVAHVVDFFLDDASGFVTGQCLYLGGV